MAVGLLQTEVQGTREVYFDPRTLEIIIAEGTEPEGFIKIEYDPTADLREAIIKGLANYTLSLQAENSRLETENSRLETALEMLGDTWSTIAHDVKNYLTVANGYANLVRRRADQAMADPLEKIAQSVRMVAKLIDSVGAYAASSIQATNERLDINELVEASGKLAGALKNSPTIEYRLGTVPTIYGDPTLIGSALLNLIKNAGEAMNGGAVTISTWASNDYVAISVEDNGNGIPPDILPNLFKKGQSTKGNGRGWGLYGVLQTVKKHGGNVEVRSTQKGAEFNLYFPIRSQ